MGTSRFYRFGVGSLWLIVMLLTLWLSGTTSAQVPAAPSTEEITPTQVEELIRLLEDEQARTAFVQRLKALTHLQATTSAAEPAVSAGLLARLMLGVELAVQQTLATSQAILSWLTRAPQYGRDLWVWLTTPATYRLLLRHLQHLVLSVLPGVVVFLVLRRVLRPLTHLHLPPRVWPLLQRIWQALWRLVASVLPVVGLLIVVTAFLAGFEAAPALQRTVYLLLSVALVYQSVAQGLRLVLEPEHAPTRLLPLTNEMANYLWIWTRRFLFYGVVYALLISTLDMFYTTPRAYQGVRGLLLCVFPMLVTIFVAQIVRHRRQHVPATVPETNQHVLHTTWRVLCPLWPFLVVIYAWALTGFLIVHHARGVTFLVHVSMKSVVVTLALLLALRLCNRFFAYAFRISDRLRQLYPLLEEQANRYLKIVRDVCNSLLVLLAVGMIFEFWGVPVSWLFTAPTGRYLLTRTFIITLTLGLASMAIGLSKTLTDFLLQTRIDSQGVVHAPNRKRRTLVPLAHAVVKVAIVFVAVLIVLEQLSVNTGPILAGVGIIGLAIGFGAQSLVKDVINGLFILFEDSVSVGDVAMLRGTGGLVERITLRAVTLRDLSGNVHVIPNSSIDMVSNLTKEYSRYLLDVGIAYREDVDEVISILREIDADMRADPAYGKDMLEPIEIMGLDRFADSAMIVRARLKTKPIQQWRVGREFNRRIKKVFDERGIEMPFPHRTLYWGMPKQGAQQPIQVSMEQPPNIGQEE